MGSLRQDVADLQASCPRTGDARGPGCCPEPTAQGRSGRVTSGWDEGQPPPTPEYVWRITLAPCGQSQPLSSPLTLRGAGEQPRSHLGPLHLQSWNTFLPRSHRATATASLFLEAD